MTREPTTVRISMSDPTADAAVLDLLTHRLRRRLLTLDDDPPWQQRVRGASHEPTTVAVVGDATLHVTTVASWGQLGRLIELVRSWVAQEERVAVRIAVGGTGLTVSGAAATVPPDAVEDWAQRALDERHRMA